jgi:hypothetical protein
MAAAHVDDAILVATAAMFEETHRILVNMMTCEGGAMAWAKDHISEFELLKPALMNFSHHSKKADNPPLRIVNTTVEPSKSTKHLGVYLDRHLNWKEQGAYAIKKGTKWAVQIRRVVRSGWGLTPKHARHLYTSIALLRILYGIDIWAMPTGHISEEGQAQGNRQIALKLNSIQRPGALAIVGGLRTSPSDSLCAHANITPIHLEIDKQCEQAVLRLATLFFFFFFFDSINGRSKPKQGTNGGIERGL